MKDMAKVPFPEDHIFSQTVSGRPKSEVRGAHTCDNVVSSHRGSAFKRLGEGNCIAAIHRVLHAHLAI